MALNSNIKEALRKDVISKVLSPSEYIQFEIEMEEGKCDDKWFELFPFSLEEIMITMIKVKAPLPSERAKHLVQKGMDLNDLIQFDDVKSTMLLKKAEERDVVSIIGLIQCGSDPKVEDSDGFNIVELILLGKDQGDRADMFPVEKALYAVDYYVNIEENFTVSPWIQECCPYEESKYINDIYRLMGFEERKERF